ncbi:hypothetical protein VPH35_078217 [Triticum aestivum]
MDMEKKGGRNYLTWTDEMDEAMLNVFVEHYNRGDHAQNGWKPHVYSAVVNNVRAKCNVDITKENVISGCKTIDIHYVNVSKMLSTSGFGWDWIHNNLMVDSEDVWSNYVKDHATRTGARTATESAAEMAAENVNNINIESAATSSTQTNEEQKRKRYRSDDSIASMLGEKLDNFTNDDGLLAAYDILIADDRKFKALMVLPERMKKKWILKQINK